MPKLFAKPVELKPWHKQPGETTQAFAYFNLYAEMGAERNFTRVANETGRGAQTIGKVAKWNNWRDRVDAYDQHMQSLAEQAVTKATIRSAIISQKRRNEFKEQEFTLVKKLLGRAEEMLDHPLHETEVEDFVVVNGEEIATRVIIKPAKWNMRTPATFIDLASELMRVNLEMDRRFGDNKSGEIEKNIAMARVSLEALLARVDQYVDDYMIQHPNEDRDLVRVQTLQQMPYWTAQNWNLDESQIPMLIEGLNMQTGKFEEAKEGAIEVSSTVTETDTVQ